MPELPEVEAIVRSLKEEILGKKISTVRALGNHVFHISMSALKRIEGCRVHAIYRRGKFLSLGLDSGSSLVFHLGMTGKILLSQEPPSDVKHVHLTLDFQGNEKRLYFHDARKFGAIFLAEGRKKVSVAYDQLGPDPFEIRGKPFAERVKEHTARLKPLLLNQRVISGLGNIYVDEILFRAGIHPKRKASRTSSARLVELHRVMRETLKEAIRLGGSSINDYVRPDGSKGSFQKEHLVYRRGGEPCSRCGGPIRKIKLAARGTSYCPRCQR